jgi:hypothetical protein
MHPLDGPRLRLQRAGSEADSLGLEQKTFLHQVPYTVERGEFNGRTQKHVYRVSQKARPPDDWGVRVGEIAHNLRSALDGLVYQLAVQNGAKEPKDTQFPIFLRRYNKKIGTSEIRGFYGRRGSTGLGAGERHIKRLSPCHQSLIERLQPYRRGRGGKNSPFWLLHELNNADKHRLIQIVGAGRLGAISYSRTSTGEDIKPLTFDHLKRRVVLRDHAKIGEADADVTVHKDILVLITFQEGCEAVKGRLVSQTLRAMIQEVENTIRLFEPAFSHL